MYFSSHGSHSGGDGRDAEVDRALPRSAADPFAAAPLGDRVLGCDGSDSKLYLLRS